MYALAIGISHVSNVLPLPVYALLSGLNAATVGVIAFAAVQLATKAITDPLSRLIVVFSACAGLCYNALWYFPVLMVGGGISTVAWDLWARNFVGKLKIRWRRRRLQAEDLEMTDASLPLDDRVGHNAGGDQVSRRSIPSLKSTTGSVQLRQHGASARVDPRTDEDNLPDERASERLRPEAVSNVHTVPAKIGFAIVIIFLGMSSKDQVEPAIVMIPQYSVFHCCHGRKRRSQVCLPCVQAFPKHVSGRYFTFYCSSAPIPDSNKRDNHFWWRTSEFLYIVHRINSYDVISDCHLRFVYSIGSHPSLEGIRCSARLRFSKRFLNWLGCHTGISWTEL